MEACKQLRAAHDSGPRPASAIRNVVLHSTEGGTAASVAEFFHTTAQASTQLVVDDDECYRCLPDDVIPWGAPGVNTCGLHIEHCGFAAWTRKDWLEHMSMLHRSAEHTARWALHYSIPVRLVRSLGLKLHRRGFTRHSDASQAFTPGGHTDPGEGFPLDLYFELVKQSLAKFRA